MQPFEVIQMVHQAQTGTPQANAAFAICELRGLNPYNMAPTTCGYSLQNWQAVIAELMLADMLIRNQ